MAYDFGNLHSLVGLVCVKGSDANFRRERASVAHRGIFLVLRLEKYVDDKYGPSMMASDFGNCFI